jgi:hypothetical protein
MNSAILKTAGGTGNRSVMISDVFDFTLTILFQLMIAINWFLCGMRSLNRNRKSVSFLGAKNWMKLAIDCAPPVQNLKEIAHLLVVIIRMHFIFDQAVQGRDIERGR